MKSDDRISMFTLSKAMHVRCRQFWTAPLSGSMDSSRRGMELLATVDWLIERENCGRTVAEIREGLSRWPLVRLRQNESSGSSMIG